MNAADQLIEQEAVHWIRRAANKRQVIERFASLEANKPNRYPMIIFTAGSPGAGKTEFIKGFYDPIAQTLGVIPAVIDPDAIRDLLPGYSGANSYLFQRAVSIAVDDLFRHILKHQQSAFVDGTLSDYTRAKQNISAVIDHHDVAMICFVFQHPVIAWHFTQLREAVEGRNIRKEDFIDKFLGAKTTVDKLKTDFGDKLNLNIILKDYKDTKENRAVAKVFTNVKSVDECLTFDYTKASIERILP